MAPPIPITDAQDPRIAVFTALKERDRIGRDGIFIAEGVTVLAVFLRAPIKRLAILIDEARLPRLPLLEARGNTPLYVAPQNVLDQIAGYALHRGILGAGRIPAPLPLNALPEGPLRLPVLIGLSNHDNVGGIFRNAAAFGAAAVATDPTTADPFYRKAIRVGVGAPLTVPRATFANPKTLFDALKTQEITPYALSPAGGTTLPAPLAPRAAFLFGTEGPGLPAAILDRCARLTVPIAQDFDSLNVATTSGIVLHAHAAQHGL
ncbi:MAG: RNA methyltransferase [Pseudomonadota bacterium]